MSPIRFVLPLVTLLLIAPFVQAQVVVQQGAGGGLAGDARWSYASPMGQTLNWLLYPQIQGELDLVPDQKAAIDKIRNEMNSKLQESYKQLSDLEPAERQKKYYETYVKFGAETDKRVEEILLPHQAKRIKQIALQMRLGNSGYGSATALNSEDVAKELGITPQQIEEMKKREAELRQEIQEKTREFYKKLNEDSREKLMSVLTPAQRQKLKELEGEKFELKPFVPATQPNPKKDEEKK